MSAAAQFDWSKFGAKPVKPAFDWAKFGARPVITSPQFDTDLARAKAEKAQALQEKPPGVIEQLLTPPWEFLKGSAETIRRNVAPREGEANLLQRIAGPGPGIAQGVATGLVQAQREAGQEYLQRAATEKNPLRNVERFLEAGIPVAGPLYRSLRKKVEAERPFEAIGETALATVPFLRQEAGIAGQATKRGVQRGVSALADIGRKPQVVQSVVKEALQLPPKAVSGVEDIFRAAAPTGGKPGFRTNLYAAAGDLAEIGGKLDLKAARGGIRNPDMRPRATVNAINEHLKKLYNEERAPQIQRNAPNPVHLKLGADAKDGLRYLSKTAGSAETRALAADAMGAETVRLATADQLARLVNQELVPFESLTPAKRMQAGMTNRRLGGLKQLDQNLKTAINQELTNRGEVGLSAYERRYAALSRVRDQLQARINAVELQRSIPGERITRSLIGGKSGIASASQAAVSDVNIGRSLELGFQKLRESGLKPSRGMGIAPRPVRGLLGPGATPLPTGEGESFVHAEPAAATTGRTPTGQFKKVFTSASGPQTPGKFMGEIRTAGGVRWTWTGERWWRLH